MFVKEAPDLFGGEHAQRQHVLHGHRILELGVLGRRGVSVPATQLFANFLKLLHRPQLVGVDDWFAASDRTREHQPHLVLGGLPHPQERHQQRTAAPRARLRTPHVAREGGQLAGGRVRAELEVLIGGVCAGMFGCETEFTNEENSLPWSG